MSRSLLERPWFHRTFIFGSLLGLLAITALGTADAHPGHEDAKGGAGNEAPETEYVGPLPTSDFVDLCGEIVSAIATEEELEATFERIGLPTHMPEIPNEGSVFFMCASDNVAGEVAVVFADSGSDAAVAIFTSREILIDGGLDRGFAGTVGPTVTKGFNSATAQVVSVEVMAKEISK